jgi:multidrug efflux pump subunit AcrB
MSPPATSPRPFDVMARTDGRFSSPEEIENMLLSMPDSNQRIRLSEVAEVRDGFASSACSCA